MRVAVCQTAPILLDVKTNFEDILAHIHQCKEKGADLIVMGTHGRTGLAHVLIGSAAARVLRSAPCPVVTVQPEQK